MEWVLAGIAFGVCWAIAFFYGLLIDEDVNHWNWQSDNGPGAWAMTKVAALSAAASFIVGSLVWVLVHSLR